MFEVMGYANYSDLITHVLKCHSGPHKHVKLFTTIEICILKDVI